MNNKPLVTIALSAYNVAEYIDDALNSIEHQSYTNIEILCIDDCSTDGTYERICAHASNDSRYKVLRQSDNQGLSVSRNRAIDEACGEYIIMLDGDDLFDSSMVEKAVSMAVTEDAAMVIWDYISFYSPDEISKGKEMTSDLINIAIDDKIALLKRPAFMWVKLLKTNVLRCLGIRFEPGLTKQDIPVYWQLITSIESIAILPERLSYYRQQPGATSCRKGKSVLSLAYVMDITERYLKSAGIYDDYKNEYMRSRLNLLHGMYDFIKPEYKSTALAMIKERYTAEARNYCKSKSCELPSRVRYFYGTLDGRVIDIVKYRSIMLIRKYYRIINKFIK